MYILYVKLYNIVYKNLYFLIKYLLDDHFNYCNKWH